jgi:hypothetical protein
VLAAINNPAIMTSSGMKPKLRSSSRVRSPYIVIDGEPFWGVDRFDRSSTGLPRAILTVPARKT